MHVGRRSALFVVGWIAVSCGDGFSPEGVAGIYRLEAVDDAPLPYEVSADPLMFSVPAGSIVLNANRTWVLSFTVQVSDGDQTVTDTLLEGGTFTLVEPSGLQFEYDEVFSATLEGGRLIVRHPGFGLGETWTFGK